MVTRGRAILYSAVAALEASYVLHASLPSLWPVPRCGGGIRGGLDACIVGLPVIVPWLSLAVAALLVMSAVAILLRRELGVAAGFVAQLLLLPPFVRDLVVAIGGFLFTGSGYSGVDPDYRSLAFTVLVLSIALGPGFAVLLRTTMRPVEVRRVPVRVAALLLVAQVLVLAAAALLVFHATYQDCEHNGPGTPTIDGVPGCPDYADLDVGSVVATIVPSVTVMVLVCVGVWLGRGWALAGAFAWQGLLAVSLAIMGVTLSDEPSQNAWYDHFPNWTSPRWVALAAIVLVVAPTLTALLAARSARRTGLEPWSGGRDSNSRSPGPKPDPMAYRT